MKTTMSKQILFLTVWCCMAVSVAAQTVDATIQCGQTYTINSTIAATDGAGLTYRWLENGSTVTGKEANYTVPATKSVGVYTYIRQAKTEDCSDWQNSNAFTVEVKNKNDDGVCINGLMWAKYNVDVPGSFTGSPDKIGMLYLWDSKMYWPLYGPYDGLPDEMSENQTWQPDNDPCPMGWRIPYYQEFYALIGATPWVSDGLHGTVYPTTTDVPYTIREFGPYALSHPHDTNRVVITPIAPNVYRPVAYGGCLQVRNRWSNRPTYFSVGWNTPGNWYYDNLALSPVRCVMD
jgi:hypothetical protein